VIANDTFIKAMKNPFKELHIKIELYDSNMSFIKEITKQVTKDDLGSISVDINRPIRRTFTFSLDNSNGEFTWGEDKEIWIDKRVKIYTGLKTPSGDVEYLSQGVFIMSEPEDTNNFDGRKVTINGKDKAFLMNDKRGKFVNEQVVAVGANVAQAIRIIAIGAGETLFNFDTVTETVPYELTYGSSDNRWKAIEELASFAKCDIYYDTDGYLRLKKIEVDFNLMPIQWSYEYGNPSDNFYAGNIRQLDETELANHIRVLGGSGQTPTVMYDLIVDELDPQWNGMWVGNPYSIQKIGRILYEHNNGGSDGLLTTLDECKWRAKWELMKRLGYSEKVSLQIAPNWLHDGGDVIEIIDTSNDVYGKYKISSFQIPLQPQLMSCSCYKLRNFLVDWDFI
jgi:hypothetical protein